MLLLPVAGTRDSLFPAVASFPLGANVGRGWDATLHSFLQAHMAVIFGFFVLDDGFKVAVAANLLRLFLGVVVGHGVLLSVARVLTDEWVQKKMTQTKCLGHYGFFCLLVSAANALRCSSSHTSV